MPETFSFEEAAPPQTFSFEEAHGKRTREQVAASIPQSDTNVPWYVAAGAAAEPWVRAATPTGLWQGVERAGAGLLNLPATVANAVSSPVETPFGSPAYESGQLTQPRYALPFRPGQSVLPEQMRRPLQEDTGHAFTDVANQVINNLVEGGTTPGAVVTAPFAAVEGGAGQAAKTLFGLPMLEGAGEQAQQVFNPDLTPTQRTAAGVQAVLNTVMAGGALKDVGAARAQQLYPRGNEPTGVRPQEDPYANVSPWQRSVEQAQKRPAQAAPVIVGEPQDQPIIKSINVFEGDDITPAYQAAGEPKQGGAISFAAPAEAGAVPSARQAALPTAGADLDVQTHPQDALIAQVQRIVTTNDRLELNQLRNEVAQQIGQAAPGQREDALRLINQRQAELATGAVNPEMQRLRNILERRQQQPQAQPPLYEVRVSPPEQKQVAGETPRVYAGEGMIFDPEFYRQTAKGVFDLAKFTKEMLEKYGPDVADAVKKGVTLALQDRRDAQTRANALSQKRIEFRDSMQLVKSKDGYDVVLNGSKVAEIFKGWSRLGGEGWQYSVPGQPNSLTKRNLNQVKDSLAEKLAKLHQQSIEEQSNAPRIRSNETEVSEEGLQQSQRGETLSDDLQRNAQAGQPPSGQQGVQEVRPLKFNELTPTAEELEQGQTSIANPTPEQVFSFRTEEQKLRQNIERRNSLLSDETKLSSKAAEAGLTKEQYRQLLEENNKANQARIAEISKPIEQRGPLGGNVSTFGLLDPAVWRAAGSDIKDLFDKATRDVGIVQRAIARGGNKKEIIAGFHNTENLPQKFEVQVGRSMDLSAQELFGKENIVRAQEAVMVMKEAKNDRNMLGKFEQQAIAGKDKTALEAVRFARANWDKLQPLYKKVEGIDQINRLRAQQAGTMNFDPRDDYVKRIYKDESQGLFLNEEGGASRTGTGSSSALSRKAETIFDMIEQGKKPQSMNAGALLAKRTAEIEAKIALKNWADAQRNLMDKGQPVLRDMVVDKRTGRQYAPAGYVPVDFSPGQTFAVRKGYQSLYKSILASSFVRENPIGQALLGGVATVKHGSFVLDTFHASRVAQIAKSLGVEGVPGPIRKEWAMGNKGYSVLEYSLEDLKKAVKLGEMPKAALDYAQEKVTYGDGTVMTHKQTADFSSEVGLRTGRHSEALYADFLRSFALTKDNLGAANRWVFDELSRGAIQEAFQRELLRQSNNFPNKSLKEVGIQVARDLNFRIGNLGKQGIFKHAALQDLAQIALIAPRWLEGMVQSEARSASQLGKFALPGSGSFGKMGTLGKSAAWLTVTYMAATQVANYLTTGHSTFDNPEGHQLDAYIPLGKGNRGLWVSPFSVQAEISHSIYEKTRKEGNVGDAITDAVMNKLAPTMSAPITLLTGHTWHGHVDEMWKRALEAGVQFNPLPLPAKGIASAITSGEVTPAARQALSQVGIKSSAETRTEQTQRESSGLDVGQRVELAQRKKAERPQLSASERQNLGIYAMKQENRRREAVESQLSSDDRKWMAGLGLSIPTHELGVTIARERITLTPAEQKVYEAALVRNYTQRIAGLRTANLENIPPVQRQNLWSWQMEQAAKQARMEAKGAMR